MICGCNINYTLNYNNRYQYSNIRTCARTPNAECKSRNSIPFRIYARSIIQCVAEIVHGTYNCTLKHCINISPHTLNSYISRSKITYTPTARWWTPVGLRRVLSGVLPANHGPTAWPARGELRLAALSPIPLSATERPLSHRDGRWYWVFGVGAVQLPGFAINWWQGRTAGRLHLRGLSHV